MAMKVSYKPLWKLLIDRDMTRTELFRRAKICSGCMGKMRRNETVSLGVLMKICEELDCNIEDVVRFERDE